MSVFGNNLFIFKDHSNEHASSEISLMSLFNSYEGNTQYKGNMYITVDLTG